MNYKTFCLNLGRVGGINDIGRNDNLSNTKDRSYGSKGPVEPIDYD
jgi:hypothetical protein